MVSLEAVDFGELSLSQMRMPSVGSITVIVILFVLVLAFLGWVEAQDPEVHIFRSLFPWLFGEPD